jgi:hypothetical protein
MATYEDPSEAYAYAYARVCGVGGGLGGINQFHCGERVIYLMGTCVCVLVVGCVRRGGEQWTYNVACVLAVVDRICSR